MPIRWNPKLVLEAMDKAEQHIKEIYGPLQQARAVIQEAREAPNLPQYMTQDMDRVIMEIDQVLGGVFKWNQQPYPGRFTKLISEVRKGIPGSRMARGVEEGAKELRLVE